MKDEILPGFTRITDISGAFSGYSGIPKAILTNAANRGTQIHDIIKDVILNIPVDGERYYYMNRKMNGDEDRINLQGYIESFWKFWRPIEDSPALFPDRMYDHKIKLTGEVDLITTIDNERVLIDWKCTLSPSASWDIQGNGYSWLYENLFEQVIDKILFVRLDKEGKDPEIIEIKHDYELFETAFQFYERFFKGLKCNLENE